MAGHGVGNRKLFVGLFVLVLLAGAGLAWVERTPLLAWFYLHNLQRAGEANRAVWADRVAGLGEAALPGLLDCLADPNPSACVNARTALERLVGPGGAADPRTVNLAVRLGRDFPHFSAAGQAQVLALAAGWFRALPPGGAPCPDLVSACTRLVTASAAVTDADALAAALDLCGLLLNQPQAAEVLIPARDVVHAGLHARAEATRLEAIRLALLPGMDLLEQVGVLLEDPVAEVRRAALLAVGPAREVIHDESLLPSLHDPDPEVRRLCAVALGGRGLPPEYLELGRLLTDPQPTMRLQVLDRLHRHPGLDTALWLRRLSHDTSPAVRVAAMRAMYQQPFLDLTDRIDQMARTDPSPTVAQLAQYYLRAPRPRQ
jgi:hypothetical protein